MNAVRVRVRVRVARMQDFMVPGVILCAVWT